MPFAETATGARLHYEDTAPDRPGIPVIVIHGLLGTARGQLGPAMDWLTEQGYRVIGLTLRGYGQSTPKPRDFPPNFYHHDTDDLIAFMDALNLPKAHLLGFSDGGEVVLIAAGKFPDRCASVMAIGAVGSFGTELRPIFQRTYPGTWITEAEKVEHEIANADAFALAWVHSMMHMLDSGGDISLSLAANVTCPVLIMLGENDTLNPQSYAQKYIARTPKGQVVMFPCGHPVQDQQREAFYKTVKAFLSSL